MFSFKISFGPRSAWYPKTYCFIFVYISENCLSVSYPEGRSTWACGRTTCGRAPGSSSLSLACTTKEPSKIIRWWWAHLSLILVTLVCVCFSFYRSGGKFKREIWSKTSRVFLFLKYLWLQFLRSTESHGTVHQIINCECKRPKNSCTPSTTCAHFIYDISVPRPSSDKIPDDYESLRSTEA